MIYNIFRILLVMWSLYLNKNNMFKINGEFFKNMTLKYECH